VYASAEFAPPPRTCAASAFNYWRGWHHCAFTRAFARIDVTPVARFICEIWCAGSSDRAQYVASWFAHVIQAPGVAPQVQLLFRGFAQDLVMPLLRFIGHKVIGDQYFAGANVRADSLFAIVENCRAKDVRTVMRDVCDEARELVRTVVIVPHAKPIPIERAQRRFRVLDCARTLASRETHVRALDEFMVRNGAAESLFDYFAHLTPLSLNWGE
jgi:hypothetical protein